LDALTLSEDTNNWKNELMESTSSIESASTSTQSETKEEEGRQIQSSPKEKEVSDEDRLKMFKNAKSISSSAFRGDQK